MKKELFQQCITPLVKSSLLGGTSVVTTWRWSKTDYSTQYKKREKWRDRKKSCIAKLVKYTEYRKVEDKDG